MTRSIPLSSLVDVTVSLDALGRLRKLLTEVTYKPGWYLSLLEPEWPVTAVWLVIRIQTVDPLRPSDPLVMIHRTHQIDTQFLNHYASDDKRLLLWVYEQLRLAEVHECQEFFRHKGECVVDPHPELKEKS